METSITPVSPGLLQLIMENPGASGMMPFTREIFLLDITVAGTTHCPNIKELAPEIKEGTVLRLLRDPANEYDDWAIGIYLNKERVGWVPREFNPIIARLMDAGKAFVCRVKETDWVRESWFRIWAKVYMVE